jgi:hypothetical protein
MNAQSIVFTEPNISQKDVRKRSTCPALNILANEGLINESGEDIKDEDLINVLFETFGLEKFISSIIINSTKLGCGLDLNSDIDLEAISVHKGPEHDASLFHKDASIEPNQTIIDIDCVRELIRSTDTDYITWDDLIRFKQKRINTCKATNPHFSYSIVDQIVSYGEMNLLMSVFGRDGRISKTHLDIMIIQGRLPKDYKPCEGCSLVDFFQYIHALFLN